MNDPVSRVIGLVLERERLVEERRRLTAPLDARVNEIEEQLRSLVVQAPQPSPPDRAAPEHPPAVAEGSLRAQMLDAIRSHPTISHGELAIILYGEDTPPHRDRVRAQIKGLKRRGVLRAHEGRWHVYGGVDDQIRLPVVNGNGGAGM